MNRVTIGNHQEFERKINIVTCSTEGRRCYATLLPLPSNRRRMVPWIRSPLGIVALHGKQQ
jgi:hypothetical protein